MQAPLHQRLGFGPASARDDRLAFRLLGLLLGIYVLSMALFYPNAATNDDESQYLRQAQLVLEGHSTVELEDPFTGEVKEDHPSTYPLGPALMMAPFVALFGWRGAYVVPMAGLVAAVIFTALWLRAARYPPLLALVVFAFFPSLVMGRVAMSDVPSAGLVALGLWLFWRGQDGGPGWWLGSGFVAGASLIFRMSNPLCFVPLFAGTVLRREWRCWALIVGGLAGLALRPLTMDWYFGDALFERGRYPFAPRSVLDRLPFYILGLMVLVPGGLLLGLAYRGKRRAEIVATLAIFVCFYLFQQFSTSTTGFLKRVVLALRYLIPVLPVLAFAVSEAAPRLWNRWTEGMDTESRERLERRASATMVFLLIAIGTGAAAVHPAFHGWSSTQATIRDEIHRHVPLDAVLVTNRPATRKFSRELERRFEPLRRDRVEPADVGTLAERHGRVFLVLLDRSDSEPWREDRDENAAFIAALGVPLQALLDRQVSPTDRLRIWSVDASASTAGALGEGSD